VALEGLGLVGNAAPSSAAHDFYFANFVVKNREQSERVLGDLLKRQLVANTFCEALWGYPIVSVQGGHNLIKRITRSPDDHNAMRWLNVMFRGGLIQFFRGGLRVVYNPREIAVKSGDPAAEDAKGHLLDPKRPYANRLALSELLRGARKSLRWWEQHQTAKVLEVLYAEIDGRNVSSIRLLSGPNEISDATKEQFRRFRKEMASERNVSAEWRVLRKDDARSLHGRFFITDGYARNLPPLNLILAGTVDEILPSEVTARYFDEWWGRGIDIENFQPPPKQTT
jgi:hypothetical protein